MNEERTNCLNQAVELYKDSLHSIDIGLKKLFERSIDLTKLVMEDYDITSYIKRINNVMFLDLIRSFRDKNSKYYSLTAELVFRDINQILYSDLLQPNAPIEFSKYMSADKTFRKVNLENDVFSSTKSNYDANDIKEEIIVLVNKLSIKGYIVLLLILSSLKEKEPVINLTIRNNILTIGNNNG